MTPSGDLFIIPPDEVLNDDQIRGDGLIRLSALGKTFLDKLDTLKPLRWCARRRLIKNSKLCDVCHGNCSLNRHTRNSDGYRWQCRPCNFYRSIKIGSLFENSHLSIFQILIIIYCWAVDIPQRLIKHEAAVENSGVVVDLYNFIREKCEWWLEAHPQQIGGFDANGDNIIVEIDSSKYIYSKYQRGQSQESHWLFGGIERGTGNCFLIEVPDLRTETLIPLIERYILPGSHIMSDGSGVYGNIKKINDGIYKHSVVVHQHHSVNPIVHTRTIKNLQLRAKRRLRRYFRITPESFSSYLHEFIFRNRFRGEVIFNVFLSILAEHYN